MDNTFDIGSIELILGIGLVIWLIWWMLSLQKGKKVYHYAHSKYWDTRYSMSYKQGYEWYVDADKKLCTDICNAIATHYSGKTLSNMHLIELGVGQSKLNVQLHKQGCKHITCTDFSQVVINERNDDDNIKKGIEYVCVDAQDMTEIFKKQTFDICIDKATLDSMVNLKDLEDTRTRGKKVIQQVHRVLKENGLLISVSNNRIDLWNKFWVETDDYFDTLVCDQFVHKLENGKKMNIYFYIRRRKK